jgi:hypothetical protein
MGSARWPSEPVVCAAAAGEGLEPLGKCAPRQRAQVWDVCSLPHCARRETAAHPRRNRRNIEVVHTGSGVPLSLYGGGVASFPVATLSHLLRWQSAELKTGAAQRWSRSPKASRDKKLTTHAYCPIVIGQ